MLNGTVESAVVRSNVMRNTAHVSILCYNMESMEGVLIGGNTFFNSDTDPSRVGVFLDSVTANASLVDQNVAVNCRPVDYGNSMFTSTFPHVELGE